MTRRAAAAGPIFVLRLEARPGSVGVKQLRWLLKRLIRQLGLRCLDLREVRK